MKVHTYLHVKFPALIMSGLLSCLCMYKYLTCITQGTPRGSVVQNPPANAGAVSLIPGLGRSPGEGKGKSVQDSCLGNLMDRGAWRVAVRGTEKVG